MNDGKLVVVAACEAVALALGVFVFGFPFWVTVHLALVVTAMYMRGMGSTTVFIAAQGFLGLDFSVYLWGFIVWVSALSGVLAIIVIALYFTKPKVAIVEA